MEVTATLRYARITPRKMRLVGDLCKGLPVDKAHYQLDFCQKRGGKFLAVLLDLDNLYVKQVTVNDGPILKRFMPRAMGRATKIQKKMSHITVVLDEAR